MKYYIDDSRDIIVCKSEGNFTFKQLFDHLHDLLQNEKFHHGINGLYDFSKTNHVEGHLEDLLSLTDEISDKSIITTQAQVAIILDKYNENMFKIFEGFVLMASSSLVNYRLFDHTQHNDVIEFLGIDSFP